MKRLAFSVLLITLLAFALRVFRLDAVSLRGDEAFTVVFVQRTWEGLWKGIRTIEPNPPLMYLALRAWIAIAGSSEFATRFFSAFFGVLCVPLLYRLGREMFSQPVIASPKGAKQFPRSNWEIASVATLPRNDAAALVAAALIAINPYQIWHSQDVRNYTLWPALSLAALIFFWRWWELEVRSWRLEVGKSNYHLPLALYVFVTTASLYTHYYDTFILVAENIFVFAFAGFARQWRTLTRWMVVQIVLALIYLPWVFFFTDRITTYGEASAEKSVSLFDVFSRTLASFVLSDTVADALKDVLWLPLALTFLAIIINLARRERSRAVFLVAIIAVPTVAIYIISIGRPLFLERYLNGIAPEYYLVFAIGVATLRTTHHAIRNIAFALVLVFSVSSSAYALSNYYFNPLYAKAPDWRPLVQFINVNQKDGDIIIQNFNEVSVQYYRRGNAPVITLPRDYWWRTEDTKTIQQVNRDYRRIWFIPAAPDWWDQERDAEKFLSRYDDLEIDASISSLRVQLYLTPREFESKMARMNARVGAATLVGFRVHGDAAPFRVTLYWSAPQKIEKDFVVFVHLADANDQVIAQRDSAPVFGTYPTSTWQPGELIADTYELKDVVPGKYSLIVGMYDPATQARVPAFDANGARLHDDRVLLTQVTVTK